LISGESGTGKELVAEALHKLSGRSGHPLIKVNCAALPGQLLESELFGYEKGAFTGAVKNKPGRFMLAQGGSIFLDELGELPLDIQAKLLRVLQERAVDPLGSLKAVPVDVRVICATNKDLRKEIQGGRFREDLYFRLNVLDVSVPPLRERLEDLPLLVSSLLARLGRKNRLEPRRVTPSFLEALAAYSWPGNVRELENILERALILSRSDILEEETLPGYLLQRAGSSSIKAPPAKAPPAAQARDSWAQARVQEQNAMFKAESPAWANPLEQAEYEALSLALRRNSGHRARTAEALGISRRALQYKLKKFGFLG
jgi:two-component system NtrC family response regulator